MLRSHWVPMLSLPTVNMTKTEPVAIHPLAVYLETYGCQMNV